jgi:putative transposase
VRRVKGRSSHRVQMEFPELRKRYWGRHFWARGYFCTTSGNITDEAILQYLKYHEPTGVSRCYSVMPIQRNKVTLGFCFSTLQT